MLQNLRYVSDQMVPSASTQRSKCRGYHQCSQISEGDSLKEQSGSPINGLPHNPGINKRITLTDMSLHTKIIVSNCLIWDFQIYSLCPSRISLNTYHI